MAATKIAYPNKQSGDLWRSTEANEVKAVVNDHADNIDGITATMNTVQASVTRNANNIVSHNTRLNTLETARQNDEAQIQQNTSNINTLLYRQQPVWRDELQSNVVYPYSLNIWESPVESLAVVLGDQPSYPYLEYKLRFTVDGDGFTLTFKEANNTDFPVSWVNGEPEWEDGYTYEVSLQGGIAVGAGALVETN